MSIAISSNKPFQTMVYQVKRSDTYKEIYRKINRLCILMHGEGFVAISDSKDISVIIPGKNIEFKCKEIERK
jgi:hypothetical protein